MRIDKKFKLNKFMYVRIPSMSEEFAKHGYMAALPQNYSGDQAAPTAIRKSELYAGAEKFAKETANNKPKEDN